MKKAILFSAMIIMTLAAWVAWPAKYDLQMKLGKGKSYLFEYRNSQVVLVPEQAEADALKQDIRLVCELSADSMLDNGDMVLQCIFREISLRSTQGRYLFADYNSSTYKVSKINSPAEMMSKVLHKMLNESFRVTVSSRGRIQELSGLNELITNAVSKMSYEPLLEQMLKASIKAKISEELLLAGFENTFCILPEGSVSIGETWTKENKGRLKQGLNLKNIYTLISPDENQRGLLHFTVKSEINHAMIQETGMRSKLKFHCSQKGSGTLHSRTGLMNEAEIEQLISSKTSENNSVTTLKIRSRVNLKLTEKDIAESAVR